MSTVRKTDTATLRIIKAEDMAPSIAKSPAGVDLNKSGCVHPYGERFTMARPGGRF